MILNATTYDPCSAWVLGLTWPSLPLCRPIFIILFYLMFILTGIGYETALEIAKRNARVVIACRDKKKGDQAAHKLSEESGNFRISCMPLDLSSLKSVREFSAEYNNRESRLDILINNAGMIGSKFWISERF